MNLVQSFEKFLKPKGHFLQHYQMIKTSGPLVKTLESDANMVTSKQHSVVVKTEMFALHLSKGIKCQII